MDTTVATIDDISIKSHVNKEVLKSFKCLQVDKANLYTSATKDYLTSINDKSMIVYDNPNEIDFEGTFRLTRNKLIPVDDHSLGTSPEKAIELSQFNFLANFGSNISDLQKYCYDNQVRVNMAYVTSTIIRLVSIYESYKLYENVHKSEVMFVFNNSKHKTYLLSKLV